MSVKINTRIFLLPLLVTRMASEKALHKRIQTPPLTLVLPCPLRKDSIICVNSTLDILIHYTKTLMNQWGTNKVLVECPLDAVWQKGPAQEHLGVLSVSSEWSLIVSLGSLLSRLSVAVSSRALLWPFHSADGSRETVCCNKSHLEKKQLLCLQRDEALERRFGNELGRGVLSWTETRKVKASQSLQLTDSSFYDIDLNTIQSIFPG